MTFIPLLEPAGAGKHGCYGKSAPSASEKSRYTDACIFTHDTTRYREVGRVEWPGARGGPRAQGPAWFIGQGGRFTRSSLCQLMNVDLIGSVRMLHSFSGFTATITSLFLRDEMIYTLK